MGKETGGREGRQEGRKGGRKRVRFESKELKKGTAGWRKNLGWR